MLRTTRLIFRFDRSASIASSSAVSLRVLPITPSEGKRMLAELKGTKMLGGQRGIPAADLDAVAAAIAPIGDAALALGDRLDELDVNPLWVRGTHVEALDGLAVARK
jgi:acetate---CoA ligase (ADP-forming)